MEQKIEVKKSGSIYHFQGSQNILELENEFDLQRKEIEQFIKREIFSKNRNLNIFIGSGCSIPAVPLMGTTMKKILNDIEHIAIKEEFIIFLKITDDHKRIFDKHLDSDLSVKEWQIAKLYDNFCNIEGFLTYLQQKINVERDEDNINRLEVIFNSAKKLFVTSIPKYSDEKYKGEVADLYVNFYKKIFEKRQYESSKLNIFTTNYDLFNEIALEHNSINYSTGFTNTLTSKFNVNQFNYRLVDERNRYKDKWQPTTKEANLYKLHGSINWIEKKDNIVQTYEESDNVIIYPTILKHRETAQTPYSELFRELSIQLQKPSSTLATFGYGFGDDHINNIIFQNLANQDFTLIAFGDIEENKFKMIQEKYGKNQNFHIIGGEIDGTKAHHFDCIINNFMMFEDDTNE